MTALLRVTALHVIFFSAAGLFAVDSDKAATQLFFGATAQTEILSPAGVHILIDVEAPTLIYQPVDQDTILLTSHGHPDHSSTDFRSSFKGREIVGKEERFQLKDVTIQSIAASHSTEFSDANGTEKASNYLFLIEIEGMRILHCGDLGQTVLTEHQKQLAGNVDVLITQFANKWSGMSALNRNGFLFAETIQPSIIIPTHIDVKTLKLLIEAYPAGFKKDVLKLSWSTLPKKTTVIFMGSTAGIVERAYELKPIDWFRQQ